MPRSLPVALAVVLQVTSGSTAPSWHDLCAAGEYQRAAAILHPLVMDFPTSEIYPDADAAEQLAAMYEKGLGVTRDPVMACSLSELAIRAVMDKGPFPNDLGSLRRQEARVEQFERHRREQCVALSDSERQKALRLMMVFTSNFAEQTFPISLRYTVVVNRLGIAIYDSNKGAVDPEPTPVTGRWGVADAPIIRYTHLEPPPRTAGSARDFVEIIAWSRAERDGQRLRTLDWMLWEVTGGQLQARAFEPLLEDRALVWPLPQVPSELAFTMLTMTARGDVRWSVGEPMLAKGVVER